MLAAAIVKRPQARSRERLRFSHSTRRVQARRRLRSARSASAHARALLGTDRVSRRSLAIDPKRARTLSKTCSRVWRITKRSHTARGALVTSPQFLVLDRRSRPSKRRSAPSRGLRDPHDARELVNALRVLSRLRRLVCSPSAKRCSMRAPQRRSGFRSTRCAPGRALFFCSLLGIVVALIQGPGRHRYLDVCEQSAPLFGRQLARGRRWRLRRRDARVRCVLRRDASGGASLSIAIFGIALAGSLATTLVALSATIRSGAARALYVLLAVATSAGAFALAIQPGWRASVAASRSAWRRASSHFANTAKRSRDSIPRRRVRELGRSLPMRAFRASRDRIARDLLPARAHPVRILDRRLVAIERAGVANVVAIECVPVS